MGYRLPPNDPPGVDGWMWDWMDSARCKNCVHFDGDYCTRLWNNMDEDYKTHEDKREPDDTCKDFELGYEMEG